MKILDRVGFLVKTILMKKKRVFEQGADVSAADYDLRTPLHIAARWIFLVFIFLAFAQICFFKSKKNILLLHIIF